MNDKDRALIKLIKLAKAQQSQDREFKCDDKGVDITVTDNGKSQYYTLLCELPLGHGGTIHKNECVIWGD